MNSQDIFNAVVLHLRTQNEKSESPSKECLYRGLNGKKCAAGCLIPDEKYNSSMEGKKVDSTMVLPIFEDMGYTPSQISIVQDFQLCHDFNPVGVWEGEFERIALEYGLLYAPPQ